MIENALSMAEAKEKLTHLEDFIANDPSGLIYDFGRYLVDRLNPHLLPQGFAFSCQLAIHDLHTGVNGLTGKPIQYPLVGYPPFLYLSLLLEIPRIAEAIFPAEFAAGVKTFCDEMHAKIQANRSTAPAPRENHDVAS